MMECRIIRRVRRAGVSDERLRTVAQAILTRLNRGRGLVSVHVVGDRAMRRLNRERRGIDRPTDVLSFALRDSKEPAGGVHDLGEVFLCVPVLRRQARDFGVPYAEEVYRMLAHGVLHLLAYDHTTPRAAKRMWRWQEAFVRLAPTIRV